jgi:hypothetical protein
LKNNNDIQYEQKNNTSIVNKPEVVPGDWIRVERRDADLKNLKSEQTDVVQDVCLCQLKVLVGVHKEQVNSMCEDGAEY